MSYDIGVEITTVWRCRECPHEQEPKEEEEMPIHHGQVMRLVNYRRLRAVPSASAKGGRE